MTLVFVGDGRFKRTLQEAARAPESRSALMCVDAVAHSDVAGWIAAADVLCLPSWNEGMPNVVREAHACGRPVVATQVGGIPEAFTAPDLGILVPAHQPESLANALAHQLARPPVDPDLLTRLALIPTWDESARELYRVLDETVERRASP